MPLDSVDLYYVLLPVAVFIAILFALIVGLSLYVMITSMHEKKKLSDPLMSYKWAHAVNSYDMLSSAIKLTSIANAIEADIIYSDNKG
jgi:hypothetical protein